MNEFFALLILILSAGGAMAYPLNGNLMGKGSFREPLVVVTGSTHTCAITKNGDLKCWGFNNYGQLGYDDTATRADTSSGSTTMQLLGKINLGTGRKAKAIALGSSHTCAILDDNTVKCWGANTYGQLGYDSTTSKGYHTAANSMANLPTVNLGSGRTARAITTGTSHTCVILDNGDVKCWGLNSSGQLGYDDTNTRGSATGTYAMANVAAVNLGSGRTAKAIAAGYTHTCVILDTGDVKCWGVNTYGQLGYDDTTTRGNASGTYGMANLAAVNLGSGRTAKAIAAASAHTCAILDDNSVKCWGHGGYGQTGTDDTFSRGHTTGTYGMANLAAVNLGTGRTAKTLSTGGHHTCAILDDSSLKCWGRNDNGQLGYDDTISHGSASGAFSMASVGRVNLGSGRGAKAVSAGAAQTCAIVNDGTLKCWGDNVNGQLGLNSLTSYGASAYTVATLPAINVSGSGGGAVSSAATGESHTCVILSPSAAVKCWGLNSNGQLGYDDILTRAATTGTYGMANLSTVNLGSGRTAKALTAGQYHTCAILDNNTVKCWGLNNNGQLGYDNTTSRGNTTGTNGMANLGTVNLGTDNLGAAHTAKAIVAGQNHTCAILEDSTVKCWGYNAYGQLGYDDATSRGNTGGSMAGLAAVNLGTDDLGAAHTAKALAAGYNHTCAILEDNTVKCWGYNTYGQLGYDDTNNRGNTTVTYGMASLAAVNLGSGLTAKAIMAAGNFTCAILNTNQVKCWGYNLNGALGYDDSANRGHTAVTYGMANLATVNLGSGRTAKALAGGTSHTCALLDDNTLKCWGNNTYGQLGLNDSATRASAGGVNSITLYTSITLPTSRTALSIYSGASHVCAILDDSRFTCWGSNTGGQLGLDSQNSQGLSLSIGSVPATTPW